MRYMQVYNPMNNAFLSTLFAALPILVLLYLLAAHPWKDKNGVTHRGIPAPRAGFLAVTTALLVAIFMNKMPWQSALAAFFNGAAFGMLPIGWIIVAAMFLYTMTLVTGKFEIVKDSVSRLSSDRRLQALLIAFSFGAFLEGAAGFGVPVAIAGALMVGLGFQPLSAAVLCLIANTAPVAYGAVGTPIITLAKITGLPEQALSVMAGRQLPFFSLIIPFWLVATMVFMYKGKWRDVWEIWPATLVSGLSFAITQFLISNFVGPMLVDIMGGLVSMGALVLFLMVWKPKRLFWLPGDAQAEVAATGAESAVGMAVPVHASATLRYSRKEIVEAWFPWLILTVFVFLWGLPGWKAYLDKISIFKFAVPYLDQVVYRTPPVAPKAHPESAIYVLNWLSAAGTGVFVAAIFTGFFLKMTWEQWRSAIARTAQRMKTPLLTIGLVLGLGFTTRYAGLDAILGLAFTRTGFLYPFFAALLGWLGVFLTGSDTSSNALFGSLQRITAEQLHLDPVLIATANSTGGVMGKMIDAQSIVVSTAACYENRAEGTAAVGPIFRTVVWHSIALAVLMGLLVLLQAYIFPGIIPKYTLP